MKMRIIIALLAIVIGIPITIYFAAPGLVYRGSMALERARSGLSLKTVRVDDHDITYLDGGKGPDVILVHGFSGEKDHWTRFARFLTPSYHVIVPDLPGFGESSRIEIARYDLDSQVRRVQRFIGLLKIDRFHIAGNSMGGRIAGTVAARMPDRVMTLALFDSSGVTPPKKSEHQLAWDRGKNLLLVNSVEDYERVLKLNFSSPPCLPRLVKRYFAEKAVENRPFYHKIEEDMRKYPLELGPHLGLIRAPVLILWGDDDRILDMSAVSLFEQGIARHETVIMKRCGHTPMIERPEESAGHYLKFLAGHER